MIKSLALGISALGLASGIALAGDHHGKHPKPKTTIVEAAVATDALSTLVAAVTAADLVETLNGDGPFTVFAPTNDAFADIQGAVDTLLKPENKAALQGVLTYHVVSGNVMSTDLVSMIESNGGPITVTTVAGGTLEISLDAGKVKIKDATGGVSTVAIADLKQKNGVVHVIDRVLLPSS